MTHPRMSLHIQTDTRTHIHTHVLTFGMRRLPYSQEGRYSKVRTVYYYESRVLC